jgi:hypothetical protein
MQLDITTTKIKTGHYRIERSDGKRIEVVRGDRHWFVSGVNGTFGTRKDLATLKLDFSLGYIA